MDDSGAHNKAVFGNEEGSRIITTITALQLATGNGVRRGIKGSIFPGSKRSEQSQLESFVLLCELLSRLPLSPRSSTFFYCLKRPSFSSTFVNNNHTRSFVDRSPFETMKLYALTGLALVAISNAAPHAGQAKRGLLEERSILPNPGTITDAITVTDAITITDTSTSFTTVGAIDTVTATVTGFTSTLTSTTTAFDTETSTTTAVATTGMRLALRTRP